jgi:hypothetical protein
MHYWNQDNFEGLKSIGQKFSSIDGYELFGSYCLQKESGFKKPANIAVEEFIAITKTKPLDKQREIAVELSILGFWNGNIHQLLNYPLVTYLTGVLTQWTADEPENPTPYKWLGYLTRDISWYEKALQLDPNDDICISRIALAHINDLDHQTHHLSESLFLGTLDDAKKSLASARQLTARLTIDTARATLNEELEYYVNLLRCWEEYEALPEKPPFPDWCASNGHAFNFWSIVYYEK